MTGSKKLESTLKVFIFLSFQLATLFQTMGHTIHSASNINSSFCLPLKKKKLAKTSCFHPLNRNFSFNFDLIPCGLLIFP